MDTLLTILKSAAPLLATAVAGPAGGLAVGWIADKLGIPRPTFYNKASYKHQASLSIAESSRALKMAKDMKKDLDRVIEMYSISNDE